MSDLNIGTRVEPAPVCATHRDHATAIARDALDSRLRQSDIALARLASLATYARQKVRSFQVTRAPFDHDAMTMAVADVESQLGVVKKLTA